MQLAVDMVVLEGKELGKLHVLRFKGSEGLAEQRAKKFMQLQRTAAGWRRLVAASEDEEEVALFVDGDKKKHMVRTEIVAKKLTDLLEKQLTTRKIVGNRQLGKVHLEWISRARV